MRRAWLLPIAVGAIAGSVTLASAASLTVTSKDLTVLSVTATPPPTGDTTAPALVSLQMLDTNANGKVDRVVATFNETLASYTAGTTPWTLTNVPSGGTLASVSVTGQVATLTINEGSGSVNTAVGSFTVALAANAEGIRDAAGNRSAFTATAPADKAAPVVTGLSSSNGGGTLGRAQQGDTVTLTFSEVLDASTMCATWNNGSTQTLSSGVVVTVRNQSETGTPTDHLEVAATCGAAGTLNLGYIDLGDSGYIQNGTRTFGTSQVPSQVQWTPTARTVVITLGAQFGSSHNNDGFDGTATQIYHQPASIRDLAGNGHATSFARTGTFF